MGKWAARLAKLVEDPHPERTDKTDTTKKEEVLSVLSVPPAAGEQFLSACQRPHGALADIPSPHSLRASEPGSRESVDSAALHACWWLIDVNGDRQILTVSPPASQAEIEQRHQMRAEPRNEKSIACIECRHRVRQGLSEDYCDVRKGLLPPSSADPTFRRLPADGGATCDLWEGRA